jgi:hypothetical protein
MIWLCRKCNAYVWCHKNSKASLWTLANDELRSLRRCAKDLFIKHKLWWEWKVSPKKKNKAYRELWQILCIPTEQVHFAMFWNDICEKIINIFIL